LGNKSKRKRQRVLLYLALGVLSLTWLATACAPVQKTIADIQAQQQLSQYRYYLASGFYDTVIEQSRKVLLESETKPPADLALYALGEVYADYAYRGRDYELSKQYFEKLIKNFPYSPLTSEARNYLSLYEALEAKDQTIGSLRNQCARAEAAAERAAVLGAAPRPVVENRNFEAAVQKNEQIVREAGKSPPADEALYNLGLIYAHIDNPAKDYSKAQEYFSKLTREFPGSPLVEEARIWLGLFGVFEKMRQIDLEIEEQKKQLIR
jgi:outer membrane protein assembly factor BamD (BamD/ComL family)